MEVEVKLRKSGETSYFKEKKTERRYRVTYLEVSKKEKSYN